MLLGDLGARVRSLRQTRAWTQRSLAERAGLSPRFLAQIEAGKGNVSLERLERLSRALGTVPAALLDPSAQPARPHAATRSQELLAMRASIGELLDRRNPAELKEVRRWLEARFAQRRAPIIALLGLRGAGKSTIGSRLARRLGLPFIELDAAIEQTAGLSLAEIFELHGERYYRRLERETLMRLLAEADGLVLATGGSLVTDRETYRLLKRRAVTVWLKARPEDHWNRVLLQGDQRPMAEHPHAMAELRALLSARERLYAEAEQVIDTSRLSVEAAVNELAREFGTWRTLPSA